MLGAARDGIPQKAGRLKFALRRAFGSTRVEKHVKGPKRLPHANSEALASKGASEMPEHQFSFRFREGTEDERTIVYFYSDKGLGRIREKILHRIARQPRDYWAGFFAASKSGQAQKFKSNDATR